MSAPKLEAVKMRFQFNKRGLAEDPVGHHVALRLRGRLLLGEVKSVRYVYGRGCFELTVTHFNGEEWPLKPVASAVEIIAR